MLDQIHDMLHEYHNFASYPCFANVRALISATQDDLLLWPKRPAVKSISANDITAVLNRQWRSMSNTSSACLALNLNPEAGTGYTIRGKSRARKQDSNLVVAGSLPVLVNYLTYQDTKLTHQIYFSLAQNKFVDTQHRDPSLIPLNEICGRYAKPRRSLDNSSLSAFQSQLNQSALNRLADEIREKWATFVYPVQICHGLTLWQEQGWRASLRKYRRHHVF